MTAAQAEFRPDAAPGWRRYAAVLLLTAGIGALLWLIANYPQQTWQAPATVPVTLQGAHYRLAPDQLVWLSTFSELHFQEGERAARQHVAAEVGDALDTAFSGVRQRLPAFADWYYSLGGEYARLAHAALSWVDPASGRFVAERAASVLFPPAQWEQHLTALDDAAFARLYSHQTAVREGWLAELSRRLSEHRVPAPLHRSDAAQVAPDMVHMDVLLQELMVRERAALESRAAFATLTAGGVMLGPAVWRAASARSAAAGARVSATRAAGRGAARAGSAAAGGAAVCSPGGPVALGCAVVAGAAAWLVADWTLLRIDEALHREALLEAMDESLELLRQDMEREILASYDGLIAGQFGAAQDEIRRTFVPRRAGASTGAD
jgi:hypothetical protein